MLSNFKKMVKGSGFISDGFLAFFVTWKKMRKIKKIKEAHDPAWYNEYLKMTKKLKEFFIQAKNNENCAIIPFEYLKGCDKDMLQLYLNEIYVSHDVKSEIDVEEGVYIIYLTREYIKSN